jgi:hypothetical protein
MSRYQPPDEAARWLATHDPQQTRSTGRRPAKGSRAGLVTAGEIEARWQRGRLRVWMPAVRIYGGEKGHAVVRLTRKEAEALRDLLGRALEEGQR